MAVRVRAVILNIFILNVVVLVQSLEVDSLLRKSLGKEACEVLLISHGGIDKGMEIFYLLKLLNILPTDFGRSVIQLQNLETLLEIKESEKFRNAAAGMSCLAIITQNSTDMEISRLIDTVNDFKIAKKYLVLSIETLNTTLLRNRRINFNVIINHHGAGELVCTINIHN